MSKLADLLAAADVRAEDLADPDVRAEYERTALASAVALRVVSYRAAHDLTQAELARRLGLAQPAVARIEAGDEIARENIADRVDAPDFIAKRAPIAIPLDVIHVGLGRTAERYNRDMLWRTLSGLGHY